MIRVQIFLILLITMVCGGFLSAADVSPSKIPPLSAFVIKESGLVKAWIYFSDKGTGNQSLLKKPELLLSERSLQRRLKVTSAESIVELSDLPLEESYIDELRPFFTSLRVKSRWLNAVSVEMRPSDLTAIQSFAFVRKIEPVRVYLRPNPEVEGMTLEEIETLYKTSDGALDYGESLTQLELMNVPALHEMGYHGEGVLIAMLDDGFNLVYLHKAFKHLNIVATRDFIHGDDFVDDSGLAASEGWHGTQTLSAIAGYVPGFLIGPAFNAAFLLAKTEVDASETQIEEDFWVAGVEWADSLGADIISSSLGYIDWYSWLHMDGATAVTTIAADMAVDKGILVFNSAGNEGDNINHNTLIAPADGKKVLAVAAVDRFGLRASFSSVGPSADGRTKPDIAAMGSSAYLASSSDTSAFIRNNGTSFACPLAAGASALLLCAYPELTPLQVQMALRNTASQSFAPTKYLGWGIIDVKKALSYIDTASFSPMEMAENLELYQNKPNPFYGQTTIPYRLKNAGLVEIHIYNILGQHLASSKTRLCEAKRSYSLVVTADAFREFPSGVYIYKIIVLDTGTNRIFTKSKKMVFVK